MRTFIILAGTGALICFILTRWSRPKSPEPGSLSEVFKGIAEEMTKPLGEIGREIPGNG